MMNLWMVICLLCIQAYAGLTQEQEDDFINSFFINEAKNSQNGFFQATDPPAFSETPQVCERNQKCVPRINCINGAPNKGGVKLIDPRLGPSPSKKCDDYISVCCNKNDMLQSDDYKTEKNPACGIRNKTGVGFKIVGGDLEAQFAEFPWMVAILSEESIAGTIRNLYRCGGSLIGRNVVLTAAHCAGQLNAKNSIVRAGEWDTQTKNEPIAHQDKRVREIVVHERFDRGTLYNDVALVIVDDPFEYQAHIKPTCLPDPNQNFDFERCFATGWGKDKFGRAGTYQVILKKIDLPIVLKPVCEANLRKTRLSSSYVLDRSFVCAGGEEGKDTCQGDGGSPLVCPIDGNADQYTQVGIVAYGVGCGTKDVPSVYADVAYLRPWIDLQLRSRNIDISEYIP